MRGLGEDNVPQAIFHEMVRRLATLVRSTEAAGFVLARPSPLAAAELLPVVHIRPDDPGPEVRAAAVAALHDVAGPCVEQRRDGVIDVGWPGGSQPSQKCLVALLAYGDETFGVMTFIVRCEADEARRRLGIVQGLPDGPAS